MTNKQPNHTVKVRAASSYKNYIGETRYEDKTLGAAWVTEGVAINLHSDFDIAVPLSQIVLVPRKDKEETVDKK